MVAGWGHASGPYLQPRRGLPGSPLAPSRGAPRAGSRGARPRRPRARGCVHRTGRSGAARLVDRGRGRRTTFRRRRPLRAQRTRGVLGDPPVERRRRRRDTGVTGRPDKLLVLDTPSLYFRAFYGIPDTITASDGTPVNAIRGLLDFIARLVRDRQPTRFVAAMDEDWRPAWRVKALPSYKAHRVGVDGGDQTPPGLGVQVPIIEEVLDALGLCRLGIAGYEADDVIGTLTATAGCPVDVVTGDRDLFQLVRDDQPVRIVYTAKGVGQAAAWDEAAVTAKYGIPGRGYGEIAILRGDPSDGLPGVPGVGEKTAAALVNRFGTAEEILTAAQSGDDKGFPAGARAKVLAAADYLDRAPAVVRVVCDIDLPRLTDRLAATPKDPERLLELADRWSLEGALNRGLNALQEAGSSAA